MELSKQITDNLTLGHVSGDIDQSTFTSILQLAYQSLSTPPSAQPADDKRFSQLFGTTSLPATRTDPDITSNEKFQFYTAVLTFVTEICRFDLSIPEIKSFLEDKLDEQRLNEFLQLQAKNVSNIRLQLSLHGVNFSQIVDFHWRLDYNVHSHALEDMREQNYSLSFVLLDPITQQQSTVTCQADLAQMNELLGHVKDALSKKA